MKINQTFSEKTKEEVCHKEYDEESMKAILSSFLSNSLEMSVNSKGVTWEIKTQYSFVLRFIDNIIRELYVVDKEISYTEISKLNNRRTYKMKIHGNFDQIISDLELLQEPKTNVRTRQQKMSYLLGSFLSGGSISSIEKSHYHLELRSCNLPYTLRLQQMLRDFGLSITLLKRNKKYILYIKKSENMSDFLKIIGAYNAMMALEDKRISRDFNNSFHRLNNLDVSNIKKSSLAGASQCDKIKKIKKLESFEKQPDKFKKFCQIRLKNPEASLTEISKIFAEKYNIKISRTGLNHFVAKIKKQKI